MKNDLQLLIEELQKEHDYLTTELNACIEDWDFDGAEAYKEALYYVSNQLRVVKNLENPHQEQIDFARERIELSKKFLDKGNYTNSEYKYIKEEISKAEERLSIYSNTDRRHYYDSDEVLICLEKIRREEISRFDIKFAYEGYVIKIEKNNSSLFINIFFTGTHESWGLLDYAAAELRKIKFQVNENNASIALTDFETIPDLFIITLLSRVVFDAFKLYGNRKAVITYRD